MKKIIGISALLVFICLVTWLKAPNFATAYNIQNVVRWSSLFGIVSIGVSFVIITGGIDLSIGSVIGLTGCLLPYLLVQSGFSVPAAIVAVLAVSLLIGLIHGLLITKLRLQPFVVTLCGLLIYRGFIRWLTDDRTQGFGTSYDGVRVMAIGKLSIGSIGIPMPFVILVFVAILAAFFLNNTIYGRYLLAIGRNEEAARYSGINTDRMKIIAYVICALLSGLGGILFALDVNSVQPSGQGNFYELYAIAAAVLGGCSLRGGEGSILGVIIGATVMRVLYNSINIMGLPTQLEFAIIGLVILAGVIADELIRRYAAGRRAIQAAAQLKSDAAPAASPALTKAEPAK